MGVIKGFSVFVDILEFHFSSWIEGDVMKDHHDFLEKIVDFDWWFELGGYQYFYWSIILENVVELIEHCFVILFHELFTSFLLILNSNWLLPLFCRQFLPVFPLLHLNLILDDVPLIVYLHSLLFIFDLVGLLLKSSCKLEHALWSLPDRLDLLLDGTHLLFMGFGFLLFGHC